MKTNQLAVARTILLSHGVFNPVEFFDMSCADITDMRGGIYFLLKSQDIVYVGQTAWFSQRIISHYGELTTRKVRACKWDSVFCVEVPEIKRNFVERDLYRAFSPQMNGGQWTANYRMIPVSKTPASL